MKATRHRLVASEAEGHNGYACISDGGTTVLVAWTVSKR
jgi:hypothetical protein